jgi:MoxR-like ATPase
MKNELVGRLLERQQLMAALRAGRNVLLEGPVGAGKTHLAQVVTSQLGRPVFRIDGDSRYSEQKLSGAFDPPTVLQKGFVKEAFVPGPLVEAMQAGGVLFINEMNRLPEGVQNVLLPAIDEKLISVPRLGEIQAAEGFVVIATQNPKEFVATSHLSEAILDRFELVTIGYQSEAEEREIVAPHVSRSPVSERLTRISVRVARLTRTHPRIRRGASVRAAISVAEITMSLMLDGLPLEQSVRTAVAMALPTRIEIEREADSERSHAEEVQQLLNKLADQAIQEGDLPEKKA